MLRPHLILMLVSSMSGVSVLSAQNEIRLINGLSRCCGRVEIQQKGQWGTVCDDDWDMDDAEVVCRQMGCGRAVSAPHRAHFGQGSGPTWLDNVGCKGTENYLTQCSHPGFGVEDCGHNEDAGVVCSNVLQSPTFTQISSHSAVSPGEAVQLRCTSHNSTCISARFRLYRNGQSIKTQTAESSTTFDLTVDSSHQDQNQYSCDYSYQGSRSITSPRSSSINITVVGLSAPRISLSPSKEVTWGEEVNISCSVETQFMGGSFTLTQSSGSFRETKSGTSVTFSLPKVDFVHEGSYSCQYQTRVSSRDFRSPQSSVQFSVVVNLLQPNITFSAPDGSYNWWVQRLEVTGGSSFSIICLTPPQYPGGSFHLGVSGSNITRTQSAVDHSATFFFPEADSVHQGNYSCVYKVAVSSRTFSSPPTELLEVTVKASPAPSSGSGVAVGLLLILVAVILFFIRRYRKEIYRMAGRMEHGHCFNPLRVIRGKNKTDDDDKVCETAETVFPSKEDSDHSGEENITEEADADVKYAAAVNDSTGMSAGLGLPGAETTCGMNDTENEMDDSDVDYVNVEKIVPQREGSDAFDEVYADIELGSEKMAVGDDNEDNEIYGDVD